MLQQRHCRPLFHNSAALFHAFSNASLETQSCLAGLITRSIFTVKYTTFHSAYSLSLFSYKCLKVALLLTIYYFKSAENTKFSISNFITVWLVCPCSFYPDFIHFWLKWVFTQSTQIIEVFS